MQLKRHFRAGRQPREAVMTVLEESHRLGVGEPRRACSSPPGSGRGCAGMRGENGIGHRQRQCPAGAGRPSDVCSGVPCKAA